MRLLGNFSNAIEVERELLSILVVKSLNKLIVFGNQALARAQEMLMMVLCSVKSIEVVKLQSQCL
jgi:hypothetical protein